MADAKHSGHRVVADPTAILARARTRVLDRAANPLLTTLPPWAETYRPHQVTAINQALEAYDRGIDLVVLDAPTGSGKSLIAETIRRVLETSADYLCTTKTLQEQIARTFPRAEVLMGRANYEPTDRPGWALRAGVTCEDCEKKSEEDEDGRKVTKCRWCVDVGMCPYEVAKGRALGADLACLNTAYWLTEANGPGRFSGRAGLVICDESDLLESELMRYVEVSIGNRNAEKWGVNPPAKVTVESAWGPWCEETLRALAESRSKVRDRDVRGAREVQRLGRLIGQVKGLAKGLAEGEQTWVYTGGEREISFKPVTVDQIGQKYLWKHGKRWLLMSATVIAPGQMLEDLGWQGEYEVVTVPSTFPVKNRRVMVMGGIDMTHKMRGEDWPKALDVVVGVVGKHAGERVLIHGVSYDLCKYLHEGLTGAFPERMIATYSNAGERKAALKGYLDVEGSVLVAPSMDRGVDLPNDACRVQIITKVPYLNLGDRQVSARLHGKGGQQWYQIQAVRTLVQMCGRGVRSEEDWATTYVLDAQFGKLYREGGRRLMPEWFLEGLVWQ